MLKRLLIGGGVVAILFLAVAGYFAFRKPSVNSQKLATTNPLTTPVISPRPTSSGPKTSLRALLGYTGNQKCDFTDPESNSQGKVYISSGKVRSDFTVNLSGTVSDFHMYTDQKDIYAWMSGEKQGFKTPLKSLLAESPATSSSSQENIDLDRQLDYRCQPETVDSSFFTLPIGVTFSDISILNTPPVTTPGVNK